MKRNTNETFETWFQLQGGSTTFSQIFFDFYIPAGGIPVYDKDQVGNFTNESTNRPQDETLPFFSFPPI